MSDRTGQNRTYPDSQTSSGKKGSSRAVVSGAGSRAIKSVACEKSRCRIACQRVGRGRKEPVPDRVPYRRSRAKRAGAGSRAVPSVAGERSRCRIACRTVGRGRKEPVSDRVWERPLLTHVSSHPRSPRRPHVSAVVTIRLTARPLSANPRPNSACSRRR